jgi:hypothetical protein
MKQFKTIIFKLRKAVEQKRQLFSVSEPDAHREELLNLAVLHIDNLEKQIPAEKFFETTHPNTIKTILKNYKLAEDVVMDEINAIQESYSA